MRRISLPVRRLHVAEVTKSASAGSADHADGIMISAPLVVGGGEAVVKLPPS